MGGWLALSPCLPCLQSSVIFRCNPSSLLRHFLSFYLLSALTIPVCFLVPVSVTNSSGHSWCCLFESQWHRVLFQSTLFAPSLLVFLSVAKVVSSRAHESHSPLWVLSECALYTYSGMASCQGLPDSGYHPSSSWMCHIPLKPTVYIRFLFPQTLLSCLVSCLSCCRLPNLGFISENLIFLFSYAQSDAQGLFFSCFGLLAIRLLQTRVIFSCTSTRWRAGEMA